ncbi:hypothetical protein J7F01_05745, partial [Streptomyces sp. ISL-22]|nr:hypothetical protein [Streptomyces sp. ISL-22]
MSRDVRTPGLAAPRTAVHAASGQRLGASHPRQEGPTDLRLVPPALAAWATAALALDAPPVWVAGAVVVCLVAAGVLLLGRRGGRVEGREAELGQGSVPVSVPASAPVRARFTWPRTAVAAVLLCVAAASVSAGLHGADLRRGPVPELARGYATVTAEVEVTSDPRLTRPRVTGDHLAPTSVLIDAEVRRVERTDGTAVATRAPVLMIVDGGSGSAEPVDVGQR